jgi:predicted DCC family thiol-disulfide oxidoreductase YuxK
MGDEGFKGVLLFDDDCLICNGFVQLILDNEKGPHLKFAALNGSFAANLRGLNRDIDSVIFYDSEKCELFYKSEAVCLSLLLLKHPYRFLGHVIAFFPCNLANFFYDIVAKLRKKLIKPNGFCPLPERNRALRNRFLS